MEYMMITAIPEIASFVESCGVDRLFIDMETRGKKDRQINMNTPIYHHSFDDLEAVKKSLKKAKVLLRINPWHEGSKEEIERGLDRGADIIMLPYFCYPEEVESFLKAVNGRAVTNILFESSCAVGRAEQILSLPGIDEVHFGLNDLRISLGLDFLFESLAGGLLDWLCGLARKYELSYGIGGIGRVGKELLEAELILGENLRLGSSRTILSRVFHNNARKLEDLRSYVHFEEEMKKLQRAEEMARKRSPEQVQKDRQKFIQQVAVIQKKMRMKKDSTQNKYQEKKSLL